MGKPIDTVAVGNALFEAVSNGQISVKEYKTAVDGIKVIKKIIK